LKNLAGSDYKIIERKSSKFGAVGYFDRGNELEKGFSTKSGKTLTYYDNMKREEIYTTALNLYNHDQLARPIINLIVNAIFSHTPDFQGDEALVKRARQVFDDSDVSWQSWGVDLELFGDLFVRIFLGKKGTAKIASIPQHSIEIDFDETNVLNIRGYVQKCDGVYIRTIQPEDMVHGKLNCTSSMIYGCSTLRPSFYWFDVLDNLWDTNSLRAAQYYGAPVISVTGVPGEHQAGVKAGLEEKGMRAGRILIFPEECKVDTLDFSKGYPIHELIDRVYQYILACSGVPQHLIYETNSSRGVAMFSADGFEMMINSRRKIWDSIIRKVLKPIFIDEGLWSDSAQFSTSWAPVFMRDLKSLAGMIQTARDNFLISKQTAREKIGLDHSVEFERLKQEEIDEPDKVPEVPDAMAPVPKAGDDKPPADAS
jgi:hypothetical protein